MSRVVTVQVYTPFASNTIIASDAAKAQNSSLIDGNTNGKDNITSMHSVQSCFDTINLLSQHIHEDQENYGLRPWTMSLNNNNNNKGTGALDIPGLDENLIRAAFLGRRILFIGDSTTKNLHYWIYNLLRIYHESPQNIISSLSDLNLSDANSVIVSKHGCKFRRRGGALSCDNHHSKFEEFNSIDIRIIHDGCSDNSNKVDNAMRDHEPEVIVANVGLWLLHFQAKGRDQDGCVAEQWIHYERWLEHTLHMAEEVGARALFFKTTNTICSEKYIGAYSKANQLYTTMDNDTLLNCFNNFKFTQRIHKLPTSNVLTDENIRNYCANGTFTPHGSAHLNQRLYDFVRSRKNTTSLVLHVFDDNTIKSCDYTKRGDARHYHPLNLIRIRLLALSISCIE